MKHIIGNTKDGTSVYVDLIHSKAAKHISAQPQLLVLAKEALKSYALTKDSIELEHDMGRSIGYDFTIETTEKDIVFYAQLIKTTDFAPYVKNGAPASTTHLSVILKKASDSEYELLNMWVGRMSPPLPGSESATAKSIPFWSSHAIIYTNQAIQTRSLTKTSPY